MSEKKIRLLMLLGFGAVAVFYVLRQKSAAAALANPNLIQPIAPGNLAPINLPGPNPTGAPPLRGSFSA